MPVIQTPCCRPILCLIWHITLWQRSYPLSPVTMVTTRLSATVWSALLRALLAWWQCSFLFRGGSALDGRADSLTGCYGGCLTCLPDVAICGKLNFTYRRPPTVRLSHPFRLAPDWKREREKYNATSHIEKVFHSTVETERQTCPHSHLRVAIMEV